jgi:alkaline phosphatase D
MKTTRRDFLRASTLPLVARLALPDAEAPYNAMGERVGEVTPTSALIHTRLTAAPTRNASGYAFEPMKSSAEARRMPADKRVAELEGACPGTAGQVRLRYATNAELRRAKVTEWVQVLAISFG